MFIVSQSIVLKVETLTAAIRHTIFVKAMACKYEHTFKCTIKESMYVITNLELPEVKTKIKCNCENILATKIYFNWLFFRS